MKKLLFFVFTASLLSTGFSQSLDEVLQKHFATIGQEKLTTVSSYIAKGKITQMGQSMPIKLTIMRPQSMRLEVVFQGLTLIQALDDSIGWGINPFMGDTDPQKMPEDQLKSLKVQADMDGAMYNYKDKGYTAELLPTEQVEGVDCFVVLLKKADGDEFKIFIDKESYMILKQMSKSTIEGNVVEMEIFPSNYKEIDGIIMAYSMEVKAGGQTIYSANFDTYELNAKIDPSIFAFPK